MRQKAKDAEKQTATMTRTMSAIEQAALKAYEQDKREQEHHGQFSSSHQKDWVLHKESGYYYNAKYGWYYDVSSQMYYGGSPPDWTHKPNIPSAAYYGAVNPQSDPLLDHVKGEKSGAEVVVERRKSKYPAGMKVRKAHPLAGIGGYQMPSEGSFSAGYQKADETETLKKTSGQKILGEKRKSNARGGKDEMSIKEKEFLAKREAARQRVQKRTMDQFGLQ